MKKDDARKLDHQMLEAMRERAVRRVQEGESPEVVARVFGGGDIPLAKPVPTRRLERAKSQARTRASAAPHSPTL
jgi:hypothetical protein